MLTAGELLLFAAAALVLVLTRGPTWSIACRAA